MEKTNTPFGHNTWTRKQIEEFEARVGIELEDELPAVMGTAFLKARYHRTDVTLWRWVRNGYLPKPVKLGIG